MRVFAHDATGVRAGRVEVAQQRSVPAVAGFAFFFGVAALGVDVVADEVFHSGFGVAIGVCGADGAFFGDGDHVREAGCVAVDGGGGGEDDVGDVVFGHGGEEVDGAVDVGAVIFEGDFCGFSYRLCNVSVTVETCRSKRGMDHGIGSACFSLLSYISTTYLERSKMYHTVNIRMLL